MTRRLLIALLLVCASVTVIAERGPWGLIGRKTDTNSYASSGLVQQGNLVQVGQFRLPQGVHGNSTFSFGGQALSYRASTNTLIMSCGWVTGYPIPGMAEVTIPTVVNGSGWGDLNTASMVQNCTDIGSGNYLDGPFGGTLVWNNRLIFSMFLYYDGGGTQQTSHFASNLLFSTGYIAGPWQLGNNLVGDQLIEHFSQAGFVAGYMAEVPVAWRTALGGPVLTGLSSVPIISRTSRAPAAIVFDPDSIGVTNPSPATALMYESADIGRYPLFFANGTATYSETTGSVFPVGTSSVLYFGRHTSGTVDQCYGFGTYVETSSAGWNGPGSLAHTSGNYVTLADHITLVPDASGDQYCYDHIITSKGPHGYPYAFYVWAYDANDLAAVKAGTTNPATGVAWKPWDVLPYATWVLDGSPWVTSPNPESISGAAYDPVGNRIFITLAKGDSGSQPLVLVYQIVF